MDRKVGAIGGDCILETHVEILLVPDQIQIVRQRRAADALAPGATFIEIGPGNVLAGLLKRIMPTAKTVTLGTADEVERFLSRSSTWPARPRSSPAAPGALASPSPGLWSSSFAV